MQINKKLIALLCIPIIFYFSSCTKILDDELPEKEPKLVINGLINSDSVLKINISKTFHIFEDESSNNLPFIGGASAKLFQDGQFLFNLDEEENGYYTKAAFYPQRNHIYHVEVEKAGYPSIHAEASIPNPVTIQSIDTATVIIEDEFYTSGELQCTIKYHDPSGINNYYRLDCFVITQDEQGNVYKYRQYIYVDETDEYLFDRSYDYLLWTDLLSDGDDVSLKFNFYLDYYFPEEVTLTYRVELNSIHEDFYKYDKSRSLYFESGGSDNPFSEPVLIYSNINNGFGIFSGFSSDTISFQYQYNFQNQ